MQTLDVISLNVWQIIISLCNLLILFFILKKFLYAPINRVLEKRKNTIESKYAEADEKIKIADNYRSEWNEKMKSAEENADHIKANAISTATLKSDKIIADAREKASAIVVEAKLQADIERRNAQNDIKDEIIDISAAIAEKMIEREITVDDHHAMIDSVISKVGNKEQ